MQAVAVALYGAAAAVCLVLSGALKSNGECPPALRYALAALGAIAAAAAACVLGVPLLLLPAAPLAALGFVQFYFTKKFAPYTLFAVASMTCVGWFSQSAFWYLHFTFRGIVPLSLQQFNLATECLVGLCFVLPGLALTNVAPGVAGLLLMAHSAGLGTLETVLYWQGEGMYPAALLLVTATLGVLLAQRLETVSRVTPAASWLVQCICLAKLSIVVVDDAWAYPSTLLVLLAVSPLYWDASPGGGGSGDGEGGGTTAPRLRRRHVGGMSVGRGLAHAAAVTAALVVTRRVLLGNLLAMVADSGKISESSLLGCTIVVSALATLPLSQAHFRFRIDIRRAHAFVLIMGMLLLVISPEVLDGETVLSSPFHALADAALVRHDVGQSDGVGAGAGRWLRWLLMAALSLLAAAGTGMLALPRSLLARVAVSGGVGGSLGLYMCGTFLPPSPTLYTLTATSCILALAFVVFTRYPTAHSHQLMPLNFGVFAALFPVTYLCQAEVYMHTGGRHATQAFLLHRTTLVGLYAALTFLLALCSKLSIALHARAAKALTESRRRRVGGARASGGLLLTLELDYLPVCGNAATVMCYLLSMLLNVRYLEGTVFCTAVLSPLMLLLSPGKSILRDLNDSNRYAPVVSSVFISGSMAAVSEVLDILRHGVDASALAELLNEMDDAGRGEEELSVAWVLIKVRG